MCPVYANGCVELVHRLLLSTGYRPVEDVDDGGDTHVPTDSQRNPDIDAKSDKLYVAQLERKWRAVLVAAAYYTNANCLVVPDAGCGCYKNPPEVAGAVFGRILGQEFHGRFTRVLIAAGRSTEFAKAAEEAFACTWGTGSNCDGTGSTCGTGTESTCDTGCL